MGKLEYLTEKYTPSKELDKYAIGHYVHAREHLAKVVQSNSPKVCRKAMIHIISSFEDIFEGLVKEAFEDAPPEMLNKLSQEEIESIKGFDTKQFKEVIELAIDDHVHGRGINQVDSSKYNRGGQSRYNRSVDSDGWR